MQNFPATLNQMMSSTWHNEGLIRTLIKREVVGRYQGSMLGIFWSFFNPLLMLIVYTFVFTVVFKARWAGGSESKTEFALLLFAGLIVFNFFAECVNRAPTLILSNSNYVKKVIFPLEILPIINLGASFFHALVSLLVWFIAYLFLFGVPHATALLIPFVFIPLLFFTAGVSWVLAAAGVYLRDISQVIGIATAVLMFLSPIFYPISSLPENYQWIFMLNPLTFIIEQMRSVAFFGNLINWKFYIIYLMGSIFVAWIGFAFFQKIRKGFADVL